jgi:hypothetical protein
MIWYHGVIGESSLTFAAVKEKIWKKKTILDDKRNFIFRLTDGEVFFRWHTLLSLEPIHCSSHSHSYTQPGIQPNSSVGASCLNHRDQESV